ncbi:uncharacterized protein TNCV_1355041 [Trichonephila clavipes]|uniref:Uncharacterized protein n=1 Tax=Trichonephila clavipes TaxID=2585209 RepID=A0A8X6SJE8_TRICX|nr:uncharacterized protein TNCV_1355041 [Trichonephila clavipes]
MRGRTRDSIPDSHGGQPGKRYGPEAYLLLWRDEKKTWPVIVESRGQGAYWRTEWRSVVFSDESRSCQGVSNGCVLVRSWPGERLQPNCLRPRHTALTPGIIV